MAASRNIMTLVATSCRALPCGPCPPLRCDAWRDGRDRLRYARGELLFRDARPRDASPPRCGGAQRGYGVLPHVYGVRMLFWTWMFPLFPVDPGLTRVTG